MERTDGRKCRARVKEGREKRVGTIGAIKKEKGRVYDLTNLTTERKILR